MGTERKEPEVKFEWIYVLLRLYAFVASIRTPLVADSIISLLTFHLSKF